METTDTEPVAAMIGVDEPDSAGMDINVVAHTTGAPTEPHGAVRVDEYYSAVAGTAIPRGRIVACRGGVSSH